VDLKERKEEEEEEEEEEDGQMDGRIDGQTNRKIRNIFFEGGTKVVFMKMGLMPFFSHRWHFFLVGHMTVGKKSRHRQLILSLV
jgi:hypothetical protein